jgi:hypothetical protein
MKKIKTVGIKNLKDHLSVYLREVKAGAVVLITDRGNVVAELHEPTIESKTQKYGSMYEDWIRENRLIPPRIMKRKKCSVSPVKLSEGIAIDLLSQERGE